MARARWAIAPRHKQAHKWEEEFGAAWPKCDVPLPHDPRSLRPPGRAKRCKRCAGKEKKR